MARRTDGDLPPVDWASFPGLRQPRTTQVPDDLFDWIMPYLTGAELKVLLYIVRRTFGFKKDADAISLDQLCNGILRHDGRRLDLGTGLKRPTVLEALRSLREKQLIVAHPQLDPVTGSRPTVYALRLRQSVTPAPIPARGSMPEHTPEYAGAGKDGVTGVCQGIPGGATTAAPQDTGITTHRQQEDSAHQRQQRQTGWKEGREITEVGETTESATTLWAAVLDEMQLIMTPENYATWFESTRAINYDGVHLRIATATAFQRMWLDHKVRRRVEQALQRLGYDDVDIEFVTECDVSAV